MLLVCNIKLINKVAEYALIILLGLSLASCASMTPSNKNVMTLQDVQVIGSHNSYKRALYPEAKLQLEKNNDRRAISLDYSHPSLVKQLGLGLRHLEIDVLLDPKGGRFSSPALEEVAGKSFLGEAQREAHKKPGLKVLHMPDVDFASHCVLFRDCLLKLKRWSNLHPNHLPVFVLLNIKEKGINWPSATQVLPFTEDDYAEIDRDIIESLEDKVITPESVQRKKLTLNKSIKKYGWPDLDASRGKFLFIFDGNEGQRELYRKSFSSLIGRSMFATYPSGDPEAAVMVVNDPVSKFEEIQSLVNQGYLVRTRSDASISDAQNNNIQRVQAAFDSGAQVISTDFYPGAPQNSRFDFLVNFKNYKMFRCNPITGRKQCIKLE